MSNEYDIHEELAQQKEAESIREGELKKMSLADTLALLGVKDEYFDDPTEAEIAVEKLIGDKVLARLMGTK